MSNTVRIAEVHPKPEQAQYMPYAPAISVEGPVETLYLSGSTASPLYHQHPHVPEEHVLPSDIKDQTRLTMENIRTILEHKNIGWREVVKVTKFITDMRDAGPMHEVLGEYFGDWKPASSLICVHSLSDPAARVELDMIAVIPK
jgi:2-iminobutanoate/2-iminopropanoate deaminase/2-aminomuconate deaminase